MNRDERRKQTRADRDKDAPGNDAERPQTAPRPSRTVTEDSRSDPYRDEGGEG